MKVSELIKLLQEIPNQDSDVYVDDPDWGLLDVDDVSIIGNDMVQIYLKL